MRRFARAIRTETHVSQSLLDELAAGWGNDDWSARNAYLSCCVERAMTCMGPILECGSGLSTLLVGAVAQQRGLKYWALEHSPEWAARVRRHLVRFGIESIAVCDTQLVDHGEFCWYDVPQSAMEEKFELVICDGPPGDTKGGRYGLVPVMRQNLAKGCVILLDDTSRTDEQAISYRWQQELAGSVAMHGEPQSFASITVG